MLEFDHRALEQAAPRPGDWSVARDMAAIFGDGARDAEPRPAKAGPLPPPAPRRRGRRGWVVVLVLVGLAGLAAALRVDLGSLRAHRVAAAPLPRQAAPPAPASVASPAPVATSTPAAPPVALAAIAPAEAPAPAAIKPAAAPAPRWSAARTSRSHWRRTARSEMIDASHRSLCPGNARGCLRAMEDDADRELRSAYLEAIDAGAAREDLVAFRANWASVRRGEAHHPRALIAGYRTMSRQLRALADEARGARY